MVLNYDFIMFKTQKDFMMHLYTDKDLKRLKITLWVILMVVIVVIIMLLRSFLKDTKKIWDYPGISNSAKMSIALHDSNWIDDVYIIDSGEKFIVVAHFMFIAGECHEI